MRANDVELGQTPGTGADALSTVSTTHFVDGDIVTHVTWIAQEERVVSSCCVKLCQVVVSSCCVKLLCQVVVSSCCVLL